MRHAQFRIRRFRIQGQRGRIRLLGFREIARAQQRGCQIVDRPVILGVLRGGRSQIGNRLGRLLFPQQGNAQVQVGLMKVRLQFERLFVFRNRLGVFSHEAVGEREIKVEAVVLGIGRDGLTETCDSVGVALLIERLHPLLGEVGLERKQHDQCNARAHRTLLLFSPRNEPGDSEGCRGGQSADERGTQRARPQRHSRCSAP